MRDMLLAAVAATVPTLAVLIGIVLDRKGMKRLDRRIDFLEERLAGRIDWLVNEANRDPNGACRGDRWAD